MKSILRLILLGVILSTSLYTHAQDYALTSPFGHGKNATGGEGGTVVTVTTATELSNALGASGSSIILVSGEINLTNNISKVVTNKTVIGLPGSKLINTSTTKSNSGILYISNGSNNVILRNLTFIGPGSYDIDGRDNLCIDGGTDIWVDHCDFQDGIDGNFDNKGNTDNVTVSWCRFRYLKDPINEHRFSNLLGSSSSDAPSDGTFNMTWAYCWWDEGCVERMLRCRNAELDFISCYWNSSVAKYYIGPENVSIYAEGCWFQGEGTSTIVKQYNTSTSTNYWKFVNSYGSVNGVPSDKGDVAAPTYSYTAYTYEETKEYVSNEYCGAGATLQVNSSTGEVSANCAPKLDTPIGFSTSSTTSSITINWQEVENADSYLVNLCHTEVAGSSSLVTSYIGDNAKTDDYFTLSTGDYLHTSISASHTDDSCKPTDITDDVYRTGSASDFVLELTVTDYVSEITFGGRSSGPSSTRTLESYTINDGSAQTDGISGLLTGQDCSTEITITGLNLTVGDKIAFTFTDNSNVQLSYFTLTCKGSTTVCEEITVTDNTYTATGLTENETYYYQVKAIDSNGAYTESNYSLQKSATADGTSTDIIKTSDAFKLLQYNSTIEIKGVNVAGMALYSITGSKLKSNSNSQTMDLNSVSRGLYIILIKTTDNQVFSKKVIKK